MKSVYPLSGNILVILYTPCANIKTTALDYLYVMLANRHPVIDVHISH